MAKQTNMMEKFDFLLGNWNLEYIIPKSAFSEAATGNNSVMLPNKIKIKSFWNHVV